MKKIFYAIIIVAVLNSNLSFAQQVSFPAPGSQVANPSLNKFVGTWVWTNSTDTVKIILKKENIQFPDDNYSEDHIIGFHHYRKAGSLIESNIEFRHTNYPANKSSILGGNIDGSNTLLCTIRDLTKLKSVRLTLTINTAHNQLQLFLKEIPGLHLNNTTYKIFTLPNNITLTKQ